MKVTGHAFRAGLPGSHMATYCQAAPEAGTEPIAGYQNRTCGYPESAHSMTPQQQAAADQAQADELIRKIGGWA